MEKPYFVKYLNIKINKYFILIFIYLFLIQTVLADIATLSVSPTTVCTGEIIDVTVSARDSDGVSYLFYWDGNWNWYYCGNSIFCSHTWSISKSSSGSYDIKGYYFDSNYNGAWTSPSKITVTVLKDNGETCSTGGECCSGYCIDGYCCNSACTDTCKACNVAGHEGTCYNVPAGQDPHDDCNVGSWSCDGSCKRVRNSGNCDGNGNCGVNDEVENCPSGTVCNGGSCSPVNSSNYCNYDENCDAGDCSATKWWTSCDGSGSCRPASDHTDSYSENVYASEGYTLTDTCETTGTTLCGYSDWNGCNGPCKKKRDKLRCDASHNCAYDVGNDYSYLTSSGKVCSGGSEVNPSSDIYCDKTINCVYGSCSADRWYRGCTAGSSSCTDTNRQSYSKWYTYNNYVISETTYKVGTSCSQNWWTACSTSNYQCKDTCTKGKKQYRCDSSGNCNNFWRWVSTIYCGPNTCSGRSCTNICEYDCGADSNCDGYEELSCPDNSHICDSSCNYVDRDNAQSYCEDNSGCTPYIWVSGASPPQCCGDDGGATDTFCGSGFESCINGIYYNDGDNNKYTCECGGGSWNFGCSLGDCASSPDTCCGDDANEYAITCSCNSKACFCSGDTQACCANSDDCVWNGGCYLNGNTTDIDSDGINEYCKGDENKWYAYPNITSISIDKSPIDRDDEVDKFTPDTSIKITAEIYDQDNNDINNGGWVYVTIVNSQGGTEKDSVPMDTCNYVDSNHWKCQYTYNPRDTAPVGWYRVIVKAVDDEGLEDTKTKTNLFKVEDIYLTNMNHYGTTKDLHITGTAKYESDNSAITWANVKCYAEDKICSTTTDNSGNFDCKIGELNKKFAEINSVKTNTFICEVIDSNDIAGSGTHDIDIGLQVVSHVWNDTSLYHDETASFNVTFKNIGDLTFAKEHLYWEVSSKDKTNPETDEDCHNTGWVDACGHLGKYEGDPHNSCGCYKQFDTNLGPGSSVTYSGSWKAKYHEFGNYNFSVWVRFPNNDTQFTSIVAGQSPVTVSIIDKPPVNLTFMFALPSPVDRDKENPETNDVITIKVNATDYVDGVLGDKDELQQYLTIWVKSDQNNEWMVCENVTMSQIPYHNAYYYGNCTWNPPNDMSDLDLGNFSVKFKVIGYGGRFVFPGTGYNTSDYSENKDKFVVDDIDIANLSWHFGNTTNLFFVGNATYISTNTGINKITNQTCSQPIISNISDGNENTKEDSNPSDLRLCGINHFVQDITCNITNGNFSCYVQDIKLNDKTVTFSYILTDEKNISGSEDITINLNGTINSIEIDDPDKFVNIYQPIYYTINFSNTGNIGWFGEIFNQTRIEIYSPKGENPITPADKHTSLFFKDATSWVNLMNGTTNNFSHFLGYSNYVLGNYNYTANLSYFWPDSLHSINFSITTGGETNYTVAAIDITDYSLPEKVIRGDQIIGKVKGYFVGSMDFWKWEEIQEFKYRVTNKTTEGKFWVTKVNLTSGNEIQEYGNETNPKNMTWNPNFWESKINSGDLSCDDENTTHRVYFLINWTKYNIYTPYVKGVFNVSYWPYFYQDFKVICVARELFEVNPEIANVPLGEKNKDIYVIYIENPSNKKINVNLTINCNDYPDAINWLDQNQWMISIPKESSASRIVTLNEAPRVGNYEFSVSVRGDARYDRKVWLNVFSEALGSDNLIYLLLLFFASFILLIKRKL